VKLAASIFILIIAANAIFFISRPQASSAPMSQMDQKSAVQETLDKAVLVIQSQRTWLGQHWATVSDSTGRLDKCETIAGMLQQRLNDNAYQPSDQSDLHYLIACLQAQQNWIEAHEQDADTNRQILGGPGVIGR
jgi:hypothetical protein